MSPALKEPRGDARVKLRLSGLREENISKQQTYLRRPGAVVSAEMMRILWAAVLGRPPEEVACVRSLEEPEGSGWLRLKGSGWRERGCGCRGWGVGGVGTDRSCSRAYPAFRKGGAVDKSLTWLLHVSKTDLSKPGHFEFTWCAQVLYIW